MIHGINPFLREIIQFFMQPVSLIKNNVSACLKIKLTLCVYSIAIFMFFQY
jgi:hypothetical protein